MNKDELKKSLSVDDVEKIVTTLGSAPPRRDNNGNLIFQTVCHGSHSHKLYYYVETKSFYCFSDCQESFDIYGLVNKVYSSYTFPECISYVGQIVGVSVSSDNPRGFESNSKSIDDWDLIDKYSRIYDRVTAIKVETEKNYYNEHILKLFNEIYPSCWLEEGISVDSMRKYGIKFRKGENEIIIPHRDIDGKLVGIRSRTLVEEKIEQGFKYMPTYINGSFYAHETQEHIYGLFQNKEAIKRAGKIMLVEGEKSVIKCDTYYGDDNFTGGLSGFNLSKKQRSLILSLGVKECILGMDKPSAKVWMDEEKKDKYIKNIQKIGYMLSPYMTVHVLWDDKFVLDFKDSPVDKGRLILEGLMKSKQEIRTREDD
jgi:hypothetical protein